MAWPDEATVAVYAGGVVRAAHVRRLSEELHNSVPELDVRIAHVREKVEREISDAVLLREALASGIEDQSSIAARLEYEKELLGARMALRELLAGEVATPTEAEILARYEQEKEDRYALPLRYSFRHIFFDTHLVSDEAAKQVIKATAEAVLARAKAGEDFAALAAAFSDNPSKDKIIGPLPAGEINPILDEAIRSATPGQVLGVLETNFGYHILSVLSLEPPSFSPLADVRLDIRRRLQKEKHQAWRERILKQLTSDSANVFRPDLLSSTGTEETAVVLSLGSRSWTQGYLKTEARALSERHAEQLIANPSTYLEERMIMAWLNDQAAAHGLVETETFSQRWQDTKADILRTAYLDSLVGKPEPTAEEVASELIRNATDYMTPVRKRLWHLQLMADLPEGTGKGTRYVTVEKRKFELETLLEPVRAGQLTFPALVHQATASIAGATGGDLGYVSEQTTVDALQRKAVETLSAGQLGPAEMDLDRAAAYVFFCAEVLPPAPLPEAEAQARARQALRRQVEATARDKARRSALERASFHWIDGWEAALAPQP